MKKQLLTLALVLFASIASAQDYKQFKLGLGFGYAIPTGGGGVAVLFRTSI